VIKQREDEDQNGELDGVGDDASSSSVCDVSESKDHNYDGSDTMSPTYGEDAGGKIEGVRIDEVEFKGVLKDKDGNLGDPMDNAEPALKDQEKGNGGDDKENEDNEYEDEESEDKENGGG
jgi:hypothetical protein